MRYRLGADGSDGCIDCIHMVLVALDDQGVNRPAFKRSWYEASQRAIARDLLRWGRRIAAPKLDGDVLLLPGDKTFAVMAWQGVLYIDRLGERVCWAPVQIFPSCPCFRSRENCAS
jgi:hypothetical protein